MYMVYTVANVQAAILQQAAEYISFLIAERQHLLELNRQYIAATRCLPVKRRKGSDGELSDDGSAPLCRDQLSAAESRYKRRSPQHLDSQLARSLPIKKRKDEVTRQESFTLNNAWDCQANRLLTSGASIH